MADYKMADEYLVFIFTFMKNRRNSFHCNNIKCNNVILINISRIHFPLVFKSAFALHFLELKRIHILAQGKLGNLKLILWKKHKPETEKCFIFSVRVLERLRERTNRTEGTGHGYPGDVQLNK